MDEVSREALRILRLFGDKETKRVAASVGAKQSELYEKIQKLKAALAESKQSVEDARKWIEIVKQYSEPTELTAELLNNMIDKIVVYEATKYENGFREQKIEIYYRFVGKID